MEFPAWYLKNEEELQIEAAESGADRELDFCPDSYAEAAYRKEHPNV